MGIGESENGRIEKTEVRRQLFDVLSLASLQSAVYNLLDAGFWILPDAGSLDTFHYLRTFNFIGFRIPMQWDRKIIEKTLLVRQPHIPLCNPTKKIKSEKGVIEKHLI